MIKKLIAAFLIATLVPTAAIAAPPKPTQAQIDAAKIEMPQQCTVQP